MQILILLLAGVLPALALEIPRHVYTFDRLAEAQAAALEEREPIVFVYTDPSST